MSAHVRVDKQIAPPIPPWTAYCYGIDCLEPDWYGDFDTWDDAFAMALDHCRRRYPQQPSASKEPTS